MIVAFELSRRPRALVRAAVKAVALSVVFAVAILAIGSVSAHVLWFTDLDVFEAGLLSALERLAGVFLMLMIFGLSLGTPGALLWLSVSLPGEDQPADRRTCMRAGALAGGTHALVGAAIVAVGQIAPPPWPVGGGFVTFGFWALTAGGWLPYVLSWQTGVAFGLAAPVAGWFAGATYHDKLHGITNRYR